MSVEIKSINDKLSEINSLLENLFTIKSTKINDSNYVSNLRSNHIRINQMDNIINRVSVLKSEVEDLMSAYENKRDSNEEFNNIKNTLRIINDNINQSRDYILMQKKHVDL